MHLWYLTNDKVVLCCTGLHTTGLPWWNVYTSEQNQARTCMTLSWCAPAITSHLAILVCCLLPFARLFALPFAFPRHVHKAHIEGAVHDHVQPQSQRYGQHTQLLCNRKTAFSLNMPCITILLGALLHVCLVLDLQAANLVSCPAGVDHSN